VSERLYAVAFEGPAGRLEALWKESTPPPRGSALFAHPHPLDGGTMHNKVVYRAAQALARSGYGTLRFNFRGAGSSEGLHDEGRGEVSDFRAAMDEAVRRGGLPLVAGGFSFGAAVALKAIPGDDRVRAFIGVGLPVAMPSGRGLLSPAVPALFVVGGNDGFGPPQKLAEFLGGAGSIVEVPGADHFLTGKLDVLQDAITRFLARLDHRTEEKEATA
jgi:alpha/beta superfamily hydrolase